MAEKVEKTLAEKIKDTELAIRRHGYGYIKLGSPTEVMDNLKAVKEYFPESKYAVNAVVRGGYDYYIAVKRIGRR